MAHAVVVPEGLTKILSKIDGQFKQEFCALLLYFQTPIICPVHYQKEPHKMSVKCFSTELIKYVCVATSLLSACFHWLIMRKIKRKVVSKRLKGEDNVMTNQAMVLDFSRPSH